jgi:hypothetical protein
VIDDCKRMVVLAFDDGTEVLAILDEGEWVEVAEEPEFEHDEAGDDRRRR